MKEDLIDLLEGQIALADHRIATATDSFERGLWTGRKHATEEAISYIKKAFPEVEEPFSSYDERMAVA